MKNITQEEFLQKAKDSKYTIIDVRSPDECASGVVGNAIQINFLDAPLFKAEIVKLDRSKAYLVYCRSGNRSGIACNMMASIGFQETYNLIGGMLAWEGSLDI